MNWIEFESEQDLNNIADSSFNEHLGVAIFKHSSRCSISSVAKNRLSRDWDLEGELPIYHLDLIAFRDLSNQVAEKFDVQHESPQLLLIKNGKCIYHASHFSISLNNLKKKLEIEP